MAAKGKNKHRGVGLAWTGKEHALLRKVYATKSYAELEQIFRRSRCAIKSRAGILGLKRGNRKRWAPAEDALLRQLYPSTPGKDLAQRFGCKLHQLYQRAFRLGLEKSEEYKERMNAENGRNLTLSGKSHRFKPGQVPSNKGLRRPGWFAGRMKETQFKKGHRAGAAQAKWVPVGTVTMRVGYLVRKIADEPESIAGKGALSTNWEYVHIRTWEDAHGPVPPGHAVCFKDGNTQNTALSNLELLSRADLMRRNTIHRLPPQLKEVIILKGAIKRHINRRSKHAQKQNVGSSRPPVRDAGSTEGRRKSYGY
jgi:HNH endonuclease